MANDFPSPVVPPDPNRFGPGQKLIAERANCYQDLGETFNYGTAWFGASTLVAQGWDGAIASTTAAMPVAATKHANWRVPKLGAPWTSVEVEVRATKAGAGDGSIRFQSTEGADTTVTLTVPAAATGWVSGTLDVNYHADGYGTIDMTIAGGAAATLTTLHEVFINYVPLTSPIAVGALDGATGFDAAEIDADSVVSSDVGLRMRDNLRTYLGDPDELATYPGRKRVAYNWSDVGSLKSGMTIAEHRCLRPVNYGALQNAHLMTVYVEVTGAAGASTVWLYHGGAAGHPGAGDRATSIAIGAGAARAWYTTTIAIDDTHQHIPGYPHPSSFLSVWPGDRDYGDIGNFSAGRVQNGDDGLPTIHAVSAWSY